MGKTGKWLRSFLTGKKDKGKEKYATDEDKKENSAANENSTTSIVNPMTPFLIPPNTPKERRRWSFRRSSAASAAPKQSKSTESITVLDPEKEKKKHAMVMAEAEAAAAAADDDDSGSSSALEEAAAIRIQSVFRSYLARKALCALKGLVKVQALVRGHLVRKQTTATLRCIQALVNAQNRAKVQRILMAEDVRPISHRQPVHKKSSQENKIRHPNYEIGGDMEENIKIVEMDIGEIKGNTKNRSSYSKQDGFQVSPAPLVSTEMGPKACSGHLEDYSFSAAQSSPHYYSAASKLNPSRDTFAFPLPDYAGPMSYDYPLFPNYMANTESYRAKVRSHSAPKQRPDSFERQPSRRRTSAEGKNVPRALRMQRSSSQVGPAVQNCQYPWFIKLDRSSVSLKDSECGSTSTVLSNTHCCRSLVGFDASKK